MLYLEYYKKIREIEERIICDEKNMILKVARLMSDTIKNDGLIHIFGCGHSHIMAEEAFYRAGGLVQANPILDSAIMLHEGAVKSSKMEKMESYAPYILDNYRVQKNDIIFVFSTSGVNGCPVEMVLYAKSKGLKTVVVTSLAYKEETSCHSSGKKLYEVADYVIDNHAPRGDVLVELEASDRKIGSGSTIFGVFIWNMLICQLAEELINQGIPAKFFTSGNIPGGLEKNMAYIEEYKDRIKLL
jgi:uncharacterized phosphosugar-binding protein